MKFKSLGLLAGLIMVASLTLAACGDSTATNQPSTAATTSAPTTAATTTNPAITAAPTTVAVTTVASTTKAAITTAATTNPATTAAPTTSAATGDKVLNSYTLVNTPLGAFQNGLLPGTIANDRKILLGGVGSDLWRDPSDPAGVFWMVTDRGPNGEIKVGDAKRRTFPVPEFTPTIVQVKADGTNLTILKALPIVGQSGKGVTGLSNLESRDEVPYDYSAQNKLNFNVNGLDTEGLVRTSNGEFWLVEEYGPSILRVDASGKVIKLYLPEGVKLEGADYPVAYPLPAIYGKRKQNRGFEALAISKDEKTLYIGLQSPLQNPDKKIGDASRQTRILVFDIASEKPTAEYIYRFESAKDFEPKAEAADMKISSLAFVNPTTLLVNERTDNVAKLYLADFSKATNLLGSKWNDLATSPSLEAASEPESVGVNPVVKNLAIDLAKFPETPKKIEGIAIIDHNTIAIANDNDFEVGDFDQQSGNLVPTGDKCKILIISLAKALPLS